MRKFNEKKLEFKAKVRANFLRKTFKFKTKFQAIF